MTTIVRRIRAGELPLSLRGDFDPEREVEVSVTVVETGEKRVAAARKLRRALEEYRSRTGAQPISDDNIRERVRDARGE